MKYFYKFYAWYTGKNHANTPVDVIYAQLTKNRPLPLGLTEFHEWSERIIAGAMVPGATIESQKYVLANTILHLKPTDDHESDAYFIKTLRKLACNQVADHYRQKIFPEVKARLAAAEAKEKEIQQGEVTPPAVAGDDKADVQRIH